MKTVNFLVRRLSFGTLLLCLLAGSLFSQSNIQQSLSVNGTGAAADASAQLDVSATDKGMLVPRMTTMQRSAITAANALLVFDADTRSFWFFDTPAAAWREIRAGNIPTLSDADGDTKVQVEESPNENTIRFDLGGTENMVLRKNAGGHARLELLDFLGNTFVGEGVGIANFGGADNTANGKNALRSNTTGYYNTANGKDALYYNTTSYYNTANGVSALFSNTTGYSNTANGYQALYSNTTGSNNTAIGVQALVSNTTGSNNTAIGTQADVTLAGLTNATAIGYNAKVACDNCMVLGSTGADAVSVGIGVTTVPAGIKLQVEGNVGLPTGSSVFVGGPTDIGVDGLRLHHAGSSAYIDHKGSGNIHFRANNVEGGTVRMTIKSNGNIGIGRDPVSNKFEVEGEASKSSAGDWLANSDARLKKNIQPLNSQLMLQSLLALRGVTYEWNDDKTGSERPEGIQYGFVAQNIREVFPTLVEEDKLGYLQTAYGTYDAMTVEAIRALNEEIEKLEIENAALKAQVSAQAGQLSVQASQLEKISAALSGAGIAVEK